MQLQVAWLQDDTLQEGGKGLKGAPYIYISTHENVAVSAHYTYTYIFLCRFSHLIPYSLESRELASPPARHPTPCAPHTRV